MAKEKSIKEQLNLQPKVRVRIKENEKNPEDSTVSVIINGYRYLIKRGESIEVPEQIARALEEGKYI